MSLASRDLPFEAGTLYTVKSAAERLGMSPKAVYRAVERGQLQALVLGPRRIRFTSSMLAAWIRLRSRSEEAEAKVRASG